MFAANAQRADALVVDGGRYGGHRAWRHTRAASMSLGEPPLVLHQGVLGHEWDEDIDNGWRPAALQTLATTSVDNVQGIMDWGSTFDSASATHSLVLHRRGNGSGALVFGAGTVQWAWGLDGEHDVNDPQRANKYTIRVVRDPRGACAEVQQLTVNILGDMGVLPSSLEDGLVYPTPSNDATPPRGGVTRGKERRQGRGDGANLAEAELRDDGSVRATGWAADEGGGVVGSVEVSWDGGQRYHPAELRVLSNDTSWTLEWGAEPWQRAHGYAPISDADGHLSKLWLRIADDSGNLAVVEEQLA